MDLKESELLGEDIRAHWYYRSKGDAIKKMMGDWSPSIILDVGAGSGVFSKYLLENTKATQAWCIDPFYAKETDESVAGKPVHFRRSTESCDADLVLMIDVLEHVDDDVGLLKEYVSKVPSGSVFVISVPAFQWMWSEHDEFLGHRRRYTRGQLASVVGESGLVLRECVYFFGLVFPLAALLRFLGRLRTGNAEPASQLRQHGAPVNQILRGLCWIELPFMRRNKLLGLSVLCVGTKP